MNFSGSQVASSTANTGGSFSVSFVVPTLGPGQYTVAATGQTSGASATTSFTITSTNTAVSLSPAQGPPNTSVTATGTGFEAGETVQVVFNGTAVGSATVGTNGGFSATFTVPNLAAGQYTVTATGQTSRGSATATFTINGSAASLSLSASQGPPGTGVTASGTGFTPGETIQITVNGASLGTAQADQNGNFTTSVQVPNVAPGQYVVTATGQTSGASASASFVVTGAGATATPTVTATPGPTAAPATAPPVAHDNQYFSQTGYRIDNNDIWNYFQSRGQVATFGYPVSRTFTLLGCQAQIFQRQVAQECSGQGPALMNILGPDIFPYTKVNGSTFPGPDGTLAANTPPVSDPNYASDIINFVQANAPNTFNNQPVNFGMTFLNSISPSQAGTSDPNVLALIDLEVWGAPISQPATDPSNGNFVYQRYQRGIMMFDATIGQTQGVLLADYLKSIMINQNVPPDLLAQAQGTRFFNQYCPSSPQWLCRPGDLQATDLTYAFQPG